MCVKEPIPWMLWEIPQQLSVKVLPLPLQLSPALALFVAYSQTVGLRIIDLLHPYTVVGLFIGGMMPFLFSSIAMKAVGTAAF